MVGRALATTILLAALCCSTTAQLSLPRSSVPTQSPPSTLAPKDPRGRETPLNAVLNFVKYAQRGDYATAAKYLQPPTAKEPYDPDETARHLIVLINTSFHGTIASLSNKPEGSIPDDDDPNVEVVGSFVVENETVPYLLVRVVRPEIGPIWLVSSRTLEQVPGLYQRVGSPRFAESFPNFLIKNTLMGVPLGQWLVWLLSIPFSFLIAWLLVGLADRAWKLGKHLPASQAQARAFRRPLMLIIAVVLHGWIVLVAGIPIFYRVYYSRFLVAILIIGAAWFGITIGDVAFEHARRAKLRRESQSLLQLGHRFSNVVILIVGLLLIITILGFDTKTLLAGLGIGGIALALAAQKTLENLIGGISLVMDDAASVGDECIISGRNVLVKEIGLRSIRVLTREGTEIAYPNGMLSQATIENLSRRTRFLISAPVFLSYECSVAQLQLIIARAREILYAHPRVETETAKFRFSGLSTTGFRVDLFAYIRTNDGAEFLAIQEDLLFRIVGVVESAGAAWAPSQVTYLFQDSAVNEKKMTEAEEAIRNWQSSSQVPFPDFSPTHIAEVRGTLAYPPERSALRQDSNSPKRELEGSQREKAS